MTTTDVADDQLRSRDRKVIATLLVATFVVILNETIMGVALPVLMVDLDLTAGTVQWLTTAFMLTMAVVIPTTGFLLQRFSTRTVYAAALGLFSAGTLLAGLAPGFWVLLLGRIVQASGTAIMLPLLMTTILTLVPIQRRGVVMGNVSIVIAVAPAIGPTLSGLILQFLPWRFLFLLVLPISLAALVYGLRTLVNVNADGDQPLDIPSVLLSVPGFGGIVFGLSRLGESSGSSAWVAPVSLVVGVVCLVLFVFRQRALVTGKGPLLDLRAFDFTMFRRGVALLCIAAVALFGAIILLPIYFQNVRGLNTLADRLAAAARWSADGSAGSGGGSAVRQARSARAVHDRGLAAGADHAGADPGGSDDTDPAAARRPPAAVDGAGLPVHPGVHHRAEPAAAESLLARQRDPVDPAAGLRRGRGRAAGDDRDAARPRARPRPAPTRSRPRSPVCTSPSWWRPASGWSPSGWP